MKYYKISFDNRFVAVVLLLFSLQLGVCQNFGGIPPSQDWKIKKTAQASVIYQQGLDNKADEVIDYIQQIETTNPLPLGTSSRFVPIILRNNNLTANGFVSYAPFRSEFYLHGSQSPNQIGYGDWNKLLSYHEYRHVQQFSSFAEGPLGIVGTLLGQAAMGGVYHFLVPDWFAEGEAVYFETEMNSTGRGRLPAFTSNLRALTNADKWYSYANFRNGSLKKLMPNHYVYGHALVQYGYSQYGDDFWKKVISETSRLQGIITPFARSIRRNTGLSIKQFSQNAIAEFDKNTAIQGYKNQDSKELFPNNNEVINQLQFLPHNSDSSIVLENSYHEVNTVFLITGQKRKKLFQLGNTNDSYLKKVGSRILYTNQSPHYRWTNQAYSDLYYYDISSHQNQRITKNGRYLGFDYSPGLRQYLAVQGDDRGENQLVKLDAGGNILDTVFQQPGAIIAYPGYGAFGRVAYCTIRQNDSMSLLEIDLTDNQVYTLIGPVDATLSRPFVSGTDIYFSSSISGTDQIYRYNIKDKTVAELTQDSNGAYNPSYNSIDNTLYYSHPTIHGNRLLEDGQGFSQETDLFTNYTLSNRSRIQEDNTSSKPSLAQEEKYRPLFHLFKFHSLFMSPSTSTPRLSWLSNDYLNTTQAEIFGQYYDIDQSMALGAEVTYGQTYTQISIQGQHRFNRDLYLSYNNKLYQIPKAETSVSASLSLPFDFSRRNHIHLFKTKFTQSLVQDHFDISPLNLPEQITFEPEQFQKSNVSIEWQFTNYMAKRDIFPKWGFFLHQTYYRGWNEEAPYLFYNYANIFLPGFFKSDGFKFNLQGQWNSLLANNFLSFYIQSPILPNYNVQEFTKGALLTANYITPLAYPEISIPHLMYTKRISANLFGEYFTYDTGHSWQVGVDVLLTASYFNMFDITLGLRNYYQPKTKSFNLALVFLSDL